MSYPLVNNLTRQIRRSLVCAFAGIALSTQVWAHAADNKIALVIGNGNYHVAPLKNPANDADAVAKSLKELGFTVIKLEDANQQDMLNAMREFTKQSTNSRVRLVFYAGHGIQLKGKNYLMPVDANVKSEAEVPSQGVDISDFMDRLAVVKDGVNLLILDACRNNPFTYTANQLASIRGRTRAFEPQLKRSGLAQLQAPTGTVIAFSTAPGSVAADSAEQGRSVYTKHLLSLIKTPGLPVEKLFKQVRIAVSQETQSQQIPWESSSLMGEFCFKTDSNGRCGG